MKKLGPAILKEVLRQKFCVHEPSFRNISFFTPYKANFAKIKDSGQDMHRRSSNSKICHFTSFCPNIFDQFRVERLNIGMRHSILSISTFQINQPPSSCHFLAKNWPFHQFLVIKVGNIWPVKRGTVKYGPQTFDIIHFNNFKSISLI